MKVVFLDIDGVLNSMRSCVAFGGYPHAINEHRGMFDEVAIQLIAGIVRVAGAKVVLSSSWRICHDFLDVGRALDMPIIDKTPMMTGSRGKEIQYWLDAHSEVESYAIIDDDSDMLPEQTPFFVHTNGFDGFTWGNAQKLCSLLGIDIYDVNGPGNRAPKRPLQWDQ